MNLDEKSVLKIASIAQELRTTIIDMIYRAGSGHPGGSLSICEILSVLYYRELNVNSDNPTDPKRDRFILSKGHAAPALYAILARRSYFPADQLATLRKIGSILQGHPDSKKVPGVEISSGSLGMGVSFGIGAALAARLENLAYRTYVLVGDGELNEGQNWEAFLTGAKYKLDNLVVIVDYNRVQLDGTNAQILPLHDLVEKMKAFQWNVIECDGHSIPELIEALEQAKSTKKRPSIIIAYTVKGKGISFMENRHEWHGRPLNDKEYAKAISELKHAKATTGASL